MAMAKRGNNEGSIRPKKRGATVYYEARYTGLDGKQHSLYANTRHEANRKLTEALRNQARGLPVHLDERTRLDTYLTDWLARIKPTVRESTHRRYAELLHHTRAPLGRVPLAQVTAAHLDRFYAQLQEAQKDGVKPLSSSTVRRVHSVLHKALADAVRDGLIARNVADLARAPRNRDYEPMLWTMAQTRAFLQAARDDRLGPLYVLAALTGMRLGELCGLRWHDVDTDDPDAPAVHVRVALGRNGRVSELKTRKSRRRIELPPLAVAALKLQRKWQAQERLRIGPAWQTSDLVFTSTIGTPLDGINTLKAFRRFVLSIDLPPIRLHDLRHLQASLLLAGGINPKVVQERLGHTKSAITMDTYSHLMPTLQREAAAVLHNLLGTWETWDATGTDDDDKES